ncbi:efflux RND transporter periplasmic adaptor subunit [Vibrio europaeus]|uniref:Efflux RND transporter periplasmic adaptor subunit n=1 Tax=Vibrio europaeus TaxID=300876 RepID=A0A178JC18_9VIBR|nr:efflux RND transporter periplasmic adaptor subunit [Vibrio europaeus]MDC5704126.1 efflux RND transporter periplasmic adaptor subunit [Vibrio europaeus]MDC5708093.1 efflux RND transporter periplasmic adaptor subunit [Vibrio europaeus]MDC5714606.1 efflux RND transporter periplasmic adaptor subunit [Vibrio europaeus]MDC5718486.1 efflux RND transporter periplasmic adaptor subunit [Vibrio europaeus]MDC5725191.1 efflux RND transporter periplasmic adaptor subunit [Vibrio europaeus]
MASISPLRFIATRPYLVSLFLVTVLTLWLGVGMLNAEDSTPQHNEQEIPLAKVAFTSFVANPTHKSIDLYGRTAPNKQAKLGAEIAGKITQLKVSKGDNVKQGQVIALIDKGDLEIQLERAQAMLKVKEKEFKAAKSLQSKGLQGEVAFTNAQAGLVEAKAMVSNAKIALRNTSVTAPFTGVVDHLFIEKGDFVGIGDPVASLLDLSMIVIEADVSERHIQDLVLGQQAQVRFINGQQAQGKVRYISRVSSDSTNTFPIEIELPNPKQRVPAGISTEVTLNLQDQLAIKVTPAMLALDDDGNLGVKTLVADRIKFVPINLVKAEQDGVWLTGLGESVDIVTTGQGFVRDGDQVIAVEQQD